jgi:hypothetical protein
MSVKDITAPSAMRPRPSVTARAWSNARAGEGVTRAGMMITDECYAARAEAGRFTSSAGDTAATFGLLCGFCASADQEFFPIFAGLDLGAEPERHAATAGPDLVSILGVAVLHRDRAGLGVSGPAPVSGAVDFHGLRKLRLQFLPSLYHFRGDHRFDFGAQALQLTCRHPKRSAFIFPSAKIGICRACLVPRRLRKNQSSQDVVNGTAFARCRFL